jgi:hypothetical protein
MALFITFCLLIVAVWNTIFEPYATSASSALLHSPNQVLTSMPIKTRISVSHGSTTPYSVWIRHDGISAGRINLALRLLLYTSPQDYIATETQVCKCWHENVRQRTALDEKMYSQKKTHFLVNLTTVSKLHFNYALKRIRRQPWPILRH